MLHRLLVRRLAVIEDIQVDFNRGLNVLSGETGAGKSILVTAIGLALGWRATTDLIRTGCRDAEVEAAFTNWGETCEEILSELNIPGNQEIKLKRIIQASGRNRVLINGKSMPLNALQRLGESLLNLYGQHEAQGLMRPESHLLYLDEYAGLTGERETVTGMFNHSKDHAPPGRLEHAREAALLFRALHRLVNTV